MVVLQDGAVWVQIDNNRLALRPRPGQRGRDQPRRAGQLHDAGQQPARHPRPPHALGALGASPGDGLRIEAGAVPDQAPVEMRAGRAAGRADAADRLALADRLARRAPTALDRWRKALLSPMP